jgi:hypothetical protein
MAEAQIFNERDRPEMTDDEVRLDILLEAFRPLGLPTGMFTQRQVRLIEEFRSTGTLVDDGGRLMLSEEAHRKVQEQIVGIRLPKDFSAS